MIQSQFSLSQETLPHTASSLIPDPPDEDNFEYNEEYEEEDGQDFYQDEEEDEDSPTVYYHLSTKKPDPKQEQFKAEKIRERNQRIQEKKEQAKHHPIESLNFVKTCEKDHFTFKKVDKLSRSSVKARLICYIWEKNLLVILLQDGKNIKVYNTLNFHLVTIAKAQKEVKCMSYCKKLGRIIVGGESEFLQLWSPKTFQTEAECLRIKRYHDILSVTYAAKSNVIVAKTVDAIQIYNTGLRFMTFLSVPYYCNGSWYSGNADFFSLSKNLLLAACSSGTQKGLLLFNLKTGKYADCSQTVFIPKTSSIEMTEKAPVKIFSCLGKFGSEPIGIEDDRYLFPLVQFTVDTKSEKLVPLRSSDISTQTFSKMNRIKNSKYFLAERFENYSWKACLLSVNKDGIEIIRILPSPSLNKVNTYRMLKDRLSIVEMDDHNIVTVYRGVVTREKSENSTENSSLKLST